MFRPAVTLRGFCVTVRGVRHAARPLAQWRYPQSPV